MSNGSEKTPAEDIGRGRVEALSDGVFAIVVTLLVLEIRVPHVEARDSITEMARALWLLMPKFVSWVISFLTVCVIWINHHRLFKLLARIDNGQDFLWFFCFRMPRDRALARAATQRWRSPRFENRP